MDNSGGIRASLAGRYASALFGLARDENQIDTVAANLDSLNAALGESEELRAIIASPALGRDDAVRAVKAIADQFKLDRLTANFLGVLAENGRLDQLSAAAKAFALLVADHRGEARAEVVSAHKLSKAQLDALQKKLSARVGRDVTVDATVDPDILGGIKVQMGSQLIDASVRTKLNTLAQAMKG
ncbi:F0F1 ATP synthase subunit delta [Sphingomicrobium lutaoense]|uniref:ATP synthase subunit delta n=1 Tax=Sphingomicrobium lutaoense TaxID=515949 RepID=A0A839YXZ3_9SPHN|nr:F0F1 ATP synthase subunit delta [Sphingomicrobium lutaoense]MBB3763350.1 F-type H+-transporting ATPase subunit delta [Sphingomicrobium lutaoense]